MQQPLSHAKRSRTLQLLAARAAGRSGVRAPARAGSLLAAFAALGLCGCALVVDPDTLEIRCEFDAESGGHDPCLEAGLHCIEGSCQECDSEVTEICNGLDDDCDSLIDEGHDGDKDGFTWCGGGVPDLADCVPSDASIHPPPLKADGTRGPGPTEACDGRDNDCDSEVDEDPKCAEMRRCVEVGCPENQICDTSSGVCIEPREVGSGCTNDLDCRGGFCLKPGSGAFGLTVDLMDNRCASACCSSADCDEGSVCVISSEGTRACLPANIVGDGSGEVGESCASDAMCLSGVCERGVCQRRCFNAEGCAEAACVLWPAIASEPRSWMCGEPMGSEPAGTRCFVPSLCQSGYCTADSACAEPCARNADCEPDHFCSYTEVRSLITNVVSSVPMCTPSPTESDVETVERLCCTNADCGSGQLCGPTQVEGQAGWHMACRGS